MLFVQFKGQRLLEGLGVGGFVGAVRALSLIQGVGVVFLELGTAIFDDALGHLHGQRIGLIPLVQHSHRLREGEVALGGVHIVDGQALCLGRHRLVAQAKAHGDFPGLTELQRGRAGGLNVVPCVGIDVVENRLCPVLPIFRNQRLHQQPRGRGGLNIGHRQETGIDRIGQILQAGGHGQIIFLQNLCIDNNGALLGGNGRGIVRDLLQGIIRVGAEVRAGDILVGKVTPKGETELTAEERLLRAIFGEKAREVRDTSLKVPHGAYGIIVDAKVFTRENGDELSPGVNQSVRIYIAQKRKISVGDKMAGRHGNKGVVSRVLPVEDMPFLPNGRPLDIVLNPLGVPSRMNIGQVLEIHLSLAAKALGFNISTPVFDGANEVDIEDTLELANDYVNLPFDKEELEKDLQAEHPYWSADAEIFYDKYVDTLREDVMEYLSTNRAHRSLWKGVPISKDGKVQLRDGRTGECFDGKTTIGHMHYLKLHHLVDDKIHARSTGPYSLVTQQPLGGKAQFGGQRFGEMEVWALEAYGAAYTLQEILTMKSDDVVGRVKTYEAIIKGENIPEPGIPESFKVLLKELQALGLDVKVLDENREEVELIETSEYGNTDINSIIGNDKDYAFEDSESFAEHGFSKKEFDDNEELVDIEEEESPETADDDIFADEVLDDEE